MSLRQRIRTLAGAAAVLTLLGLIVLDTVDQSVTLSLEDKAILVSLVAALLGVDIALHQLPISLEAPNDE